MNCHIPEGQPLTEFCMTCGHAVLAHKQDRTCSACNIITPIDLLPGMKVLIQPIDGLTVEDTEALQEDLTELFPGVTFAIMTETRVIGVER